MSARALRHWRAQQQQQDGGGNVDDPPSSASDDDDDDGERKSFPTSAFVLEEDDNDDSISNDVAADHVEDDQEREHASNALLVSPTPRTITAAIHGATGNDVSDDAPVVASNDEDWDDILAEFQSQDRATTTTDEDRKDNFTNPDPWESCWTVSPAQQAWLDLDQALLRGGGGGGGGGGGDGAVPELVAPPQHQSRGGRRRGPHRFVFGPPPWQWPAPPHFVAGGVGIQPISSEEEIPLEYRGGSSSSSMKLASNTNNAASWQTIVYADAYCAQLRDYEQVRHLGDVNLLALFVAHHPYIIEALLQLSHVCYQTQQPAAGWHVLRRALYVYECNLSNVIGSGKMRLNMMGGNTANVTYMTVLQRLLQGAVRAQLWRSAFVVGQLLWTLDPVRDPTHMLAILDLYALRSQQHDWVGQVVQASQQAPLWPAENAKAQSFIAQVLPNWAFSYALALFWQHLPDESVSAAAVDDALRFALTTFPSVAVALLPHCVDTSDASTRYDWPAQYDKMLTRQRNLRTAWLEYNVVQGAAAWQAVDHIADLYAEHGASVWQGQAAVLDWLYRNIAALPSAEVVDPPGTHLRLLVESKVLLRYGRADMALFAAALATLPADVNVLDPNVLAQALEIDPRRPRLLRRMQLHGQHRAGGVDGAPNGAEHLELGPRVHRLGPPTQVVDPDWPLLEVFWRSLLPWNRVNGV